MELPTTELRPDRIFEGQKFVHHEAHNAEWRPFRLPGFVSRDTTISYNTQAIAGVQIVKRGLGTPVWSSHNSDIHFTFVLEGTLTLEGADQSSQKLGAGDAFVIPPGMSICYTAPSEDIELLEVSLPGVFETKLV
jgi:quercetin dioxygenase-like cupin family protein